MSTVDVPMLGTPASLACGRLQSHARRAGVLCDCESAPTALTALTELVSARADLDAATLDLVRYCRGRGRTWSDIARALGITRSAASVRFRALGVQ